MSRKAAALAFASATVAASVGLAGPAAADQSVGEIRYFASSFCPHGWHEARGGFIPIDHNVTLYHFLGTR